VTDSLFLQTYTGVMKHRKKWSCIVSRNKSVSLFIQCSPQLLCHPRDSLTRVYCKSSENSGIKPRSLSPQWRWRSSCSLLETQAGYRAAQSCRCTKMK